MGKLKVGIIGCGTIGTEIARACRDRLSNKIELDAISDIDPKKAELLNNKFNRKIDVLTINELIKRVDIVVEAASAGMSAGVVEKCIKAKKSCMVMSVGGLIGREELLESAEDAGVNIYIPSGAICGIDALKAASVGTIESVTLTTRKPPKGLEGAPYIKSNLIDLSNLKGEAVIFEGSAAEAVKGFPQNVNVSAVLSLAGLGAKSTRVKIVTSPGYTMNVHELEIKGSCGRIVTRTENVPSKANPKTSELAILSAIATLENITNSVKIGT